jgi:hypothetical protein
MLRNEAESSLGSLKHRAPHRTSSHADAQCEITALDAEVEIKRVDAVRWILGGLSAIRK